MYSPSKRNEYNTKDKAARIFFLFLFQLNEFDMVTHTHTHTRTSAYIENRFNSSNMEFIFKYEKANSSCFFLHVKIDYYGTLL